MGKSKTVRKNICFEILPAQRANGGEERREGLDFSNFLPSNE